MKKLLTLLALGLLATFGFSQTAEAGRLYIGYTHHYTSGYASCGCPIPYYKVFRGYRECGTPIWNHYRKPIVHRCKRHRVVHHHHTPRYRPYYGVHTSRDLRHRRAYSPHYSYGGARRARY